MFRSSIAALRKLLGDTPLPPGLPAHEYLAARVDRMRRFDVRFQELLRDSQTALNFEDANQLVEAEHLAELSVEPTLLLVGEAVWRDLVDEMERRPAALRELGSRGFEEFIAFLFGAFGYDVELTKQTRDGGRDIIALKHAEVHTRYLIECKHPSSGATIGIRPVRELYAVKVDEGATKAILATTSHFSPDALLFLERHRWELEARDFEGILDWLSTYKMMKSSIVAVPPNEREI